MRKEHLVVAGVIGGSLLLMAGLAALGGRSRQPIADVTAACVQHDGVGMHIHSQLKIVIDGSERAIPSVIGISPGCMRPIHTHDDTGKIHAEFPTIQEVGLGQFFQIWGQPFSKEQILDRVIGADDTLRVTVNDQETAEWDQLLLHDGDAIMIDIRKKTE
ncbi:MAG: hypothetical protein G01um1014106_680 [Parcubacteria group bacterium Gr01-1014_106]|nr:MAG: hypothetical protein G01um1014106_680 [Parcubacteria group bacterium Gr01-1014_106]